MKRLCFVNILLLIFTVNLFAKKPESVAFYYASNPPKELFLFYDWVVVQPGAVDLQKYERRGKTLAYFSLSEREYDSKTPKGWILGKNEAWKSHILDITDRGYREDLKFRVGKLMKSFDGIFFDTLDSYHMTDLSDKEKREYEKALASFIRGCKESFPNKLILVNRGFEIYDSISDSVDGVVAESLFSGLDVKSMKPKPVGKEDRDWLLMQLERVKKDGKPVIVVDYLVPPFKGASKIAKKIESLGFIPYIADPMLEKIGVGTVSVVPREVLVLYQGKEADETNAHRLYSLPLEYLGFVPKLLSVERELPKGSVFGRYAAIVVALEQNELKHPKKFFDWVSTQIKDGVKVLFIDGFGTENRALLNSLGLEIVKKSDLKYKSATSIVNVERFEIEPNIELAPFFLTSKEQKVLVGFANADKEYATAAITPWGGYLLPGSSTVQLFNSDLWAVDPFKLFKKALRLPSIPVPDMSTENGRRILFVHIDGDGFIERALYKNGKYASQVLLEDILKRYKIPHSVSVIEGEIAPWGAYGKDSDKLMSIAKDIFAQKSVEPASHTFSHPFKWKKSEGMAEGYALNIPNYRFNLRREILGSLKFVDSLLPKDEKAEMIFWSGDCRPSSEALKLCYENGILNINGGVTVVTDENPWLSYISPSGIERGSYFQVYAAVQNENIFTDGWKNYAGYKKVIQSFKRTEFPRRLKPIDIYYHFFSASKKASIEALKSVYEWSLSQKVIPIYTSEWIRKVLDFREISIAKSGDSWMVYGRGDLKSLRLPYPPSIKESKGVLGYKKREDFFYVHLDGSKYHRISLKRDGKESDYIVETNALVKRDSNGIWSFEGALPLEAKIYTPSECRLVGDLKRVNVSFKDGVSTIKGAERGSYAFGVECDENE